MHRRNSGSQRIKSFRRNTIFTTGSSTRPILNRLHRNMGGGSHLFQSGKRIPDREISNQGKRCQGGT